MQPSSRGIALIQKYEGFSRFPYICPAGWLTIGYGHVILQQEKNIYDKGISKQQAELLLQGDILKACGSVDRLVKVPITQGMFDALVSFVFNLGGGRLQASTLRQKLNRRDYEGAAAEFHKWIYGGGRKLPGLIARRADEAALFLSEPII